MDDASQVPNSTTTSHTLESLGLIRYGEPHTSAFWKARPTCGHVTEVVVELGLETRRWFQPGQCQAENITWNTALAATKRISRSDSVTPNEPAMRSQVDM